MIQRIQSLWLLLAALVNAGLFYFALYMTEITVNGITTTTLIRVNDDYLSMILALLITAMPLFAIFMYGSRTKQRNMVLLTALISIGFIAYTLMRVSNFNNGSSAPVGTGTSTYWIGSILPIVSTVLLFMAVNGIRKDEKLVKSLDRLR